MIRAAGTAKTRSQSPRVDAYIAKSPAYARPILNKLRQAFLKASPGLEETIKWSCPHYQYHGLVGGFAAFKNHVSFGLWKAKELPDPHNLFRDGTQASMCQVKLEKVSDVPSQKVLVQYIKQAMALNEAKAKAPKKPATAGTAAKKTTKSVRVPAVLKAALARNKKAKTTFDGFSPSNKRDYIEWITAAKRDETRDRRLKQAVQWMVQGKPRNWKYMGKGVKG